MVWWIATHRGSVAVTVTDGTNRKALMSNDNYNLEEIHPDLPEIIEEAENNAFKEAIESIKEDFITIEQRLWEDYGDPDTETSVWSVTLQATTPEDAKELLDNTPDDVNLVHTPKNINDVAGMLGVYRVATGGDVYKMLADPKIIFELAKDDSVGMIVRLGGYASTEKDVSPSKSKTKQNMALAILCTNSTVISIARMVDDPEQEPVVTATRIDDVEFGQQRLIDAVVMAYSLPQAVRREMPKVFNSIIEDIESGEH